MISIITSSQGFANLKFSEKPTDEMRSELKSHGWIYSSRKNVWYPSTYSKERSAEGSQKFTQDFLKRFGGVTQTQEAENSNFELEDIKSGKTVKTLAEIEDVTRQIAAKYKDELKASSKWMDFIGFNIEGGMGGDKKEYLMTKAQFSNLLDNTMYYAQNVKKLDVDKLIREKVPEYRRNFVQKEDLFRNGLSARLSRLEEIKNADGNRMGKKEEREKKLPPSELTSGLDIF